MSGIGELKAEITAVRDETAARDAENAKILQAILADTAKLKELILDLVLRGNRHEKRLEKLEETRPEA